jgi:Rrf2 family transcriptional regulator, nitric oxide-sensitive transcriptional repressor
VKLAMQTDFALRTLMYLALQNTRSKVADVSAFYGISTPHVAKVVNSLSRLGFVRSLRGAGGGIELARPAAEIPLGDVILAFEGNLHLLECVGTADVCAIQRFCPLLGVLAEAERLQVEYLNSVTLADVLPRKRHVKKYVENRETPSRKSRGPSGR